MTTRIEFLRTVLPPEGVYCAVSIDGKRVAQTFHPTLEELDTKLVEISQSGTNTFFALASFVTDETRTTDNVKSLKSFFLDLDCGPSEDGKKYPTQVDALTALKSFVKDMQLPKPWVVNSGRGIHAYWPLAEPVERIKWKAVAEKIKQSCMFKDFKADPAVTADAVRILRAPESHNVKDKDNPLAVQLMMTGEVTTFEAMRKLLGVTDFEVSVTKRPMDEVTKNLLANRPSVFKDILKKCLTGEGCNQITHAVTHQDSIPEPLWRAVLSVAQHCVDRDKAIHKVSDQHPDYDPSTTERKAAATKGPYTCTSFQNIDATLCEGCPHYGKIKSPIVLGAGRVLEATAEDNIVEVPTEEEGLYEEEKAKVVEIPEFPFPYFRGKNGGVYIRERMEDKKTKQAYEEDVLIYPYNFYLVSLIDDPHNGAMGLLRVHFPQDGVKEFGVTLADMLSKDRYRDKLADRGICPSEKQMGGIMAYSNYWVNHYQKLKKAKKGRVQFGWVEGNSAFIVGDREIRETEIRYSPPTMTTVDIAPKYRKAGTLENWRKIANYFLKPGAEKQLFAILAGFSSPLMPLAGGDKKGGVISLHSEFGGTGKTTVLRMINSIFGHPTEPMLFAKDTDNATANRFGVMNNISPTVDEITNAEPLKLSNFIYEFLQNRGKHRLRGMSNTERTNTITWNSICVVTGNAIISDKLLQLKNLADGEIRRVMEFELAAPHEVSKAESDTIFGGLSDNFGVAGEVYIQHVISKVGSIRTLYNTIQLKLDAAAGLRQREEVYSNTCAGILTAAVLVKECGVMDITDADLKRLFSWTVQVLKGFIEKTAANNTAVADLLGDFITDHYRDMLIIKGNLTNGLHEAPLKEPRDKLIARYEPDTKMFFVKSSALRTYCVKKQMSFDNLIKYYTDRGMCDGVERKRLGKGTSISANERVVIFTNMSNEIDINELMAGANKTNDNAGASQN